MYHICNLYETPTMRWEMKTREFLEDHRAASLVHTAASSRRQTLSQKRPKAGNSGHHPTTHKCICVYINTHEDRTFTLTQMFIYLHKHTWEPYIYTYTHMYMHIHKHTWRPYTHKCLRTYTNTHEDHTHTHIHTHKCACTYTNTHEDCIHTYTHTNVHTLMQICMKAVFRFFLVWFLSSFHLDF